MVRPTILVIEDEEAQRLILQHNLEEAGYEVICAEDGEIGWELITDYRPDLIVLDWMMPKLSGLELCRRIKSSAKTKNTPIIMLSARSEEVDRIRGLDIGADNPEAIALSIIAEIQAVIQNRMGGFLKDRPTSIHSDSIARSVGG